MTIDSKGLINNFLESWQPGSYGKQRPSSWLTG